MPVLKSHFEMAHEFTADTVRESYTSHLNKMEKRVGAASTIAGNQSLKMNWDSEGDAQMQRIMVSRSIHRIIRKNESGKPVETRKAAIEKALDNVRTLEGVLPVKLKAAASDAIAKAV